MAKDLLNLNDILFPSEIDMLTAQEVAIKYMSYQQNLKEVDAKGKRFRVFAAMRTGKKRIDKDAIYWHISERGNIYMGERENPNMNRNWTGNMGPSVAGMRSWLKKMYRLNRR